VASELRIHERPGTLERPILIGAFRGWNDGGQAATLAAGYLARLWGAHKFADIDPELFVDFQATRPMVTLEGMARVHLNRGEYDQADALARKALELLQGREDYLHEVCPTQLVLGRALLERGRLDEAEEAFRAADAAAEQLASISHRTEAWVALGDLAARRGDDRGAARLYRNAAEALQEIRF
jgi:tetratricopeptide (TPR) repeat protein